MVRPCARRCRRCRRHSPSYSFFALVFTVQAAFLIISCQYFRFVTNEVAVRPRCPRAHMCVPGHTTAREPIGFYASRQTAFQNLIFFAWKICCWVFFSEEHTSELQSRGNLVCLL